jgi:hypothetical protein
MVGPRVHADLMPSHVFLDQYRWTFNDAGADDEEGRQDIFCGKVIEEFPAQSITLSHHAKKCPAQKKLTEL